MILMELGMVKTLNPQSNQGLYSKVRVLTGPGGEKGL